MPAWNDIDLAAVPLVRSFAVELRELEDLGKIVHFVSPEGGELAWFPAWEHAERDLPHMNAVDVPLGTLEDPYDDRDEGWRIVIFEHEGFVYVFEDDRPDGTRFPRRYRMPRDQYLMGWALLMDASNPITPLEV